MIPGVRYQDAAAAVAWLCRAFGFTEHLVVPGPDGGVVHARLVHGSGMVMVSQQREGSYDDYVRPPAAVGGVSTQGVYVVVDDVDAHCDHARSAGAEIVIDPVDHPFGGRMYTCRDPEGHVWSFGDSDPWVRPE